MVVRPLEIVTGLESIGKIFGVGRNTVRAWAQQEGCPIRRVEGKYTAEKAELWEWIKEHAGGEVGC
ncbi:MerR family transcriptional regulator [Maridesulfovibrio sp.]|uniref:MerR family transcriptional regulator n=1 Tax=Maridesulfovibrio sp. TaxID=2795000 RepID=UPI0029C9E7B0|nr:MerR family transcriptional regulator [Maridesulfovibrio sp.]